MVVVVASIRAWRLEPSPEIRTVAFVGFGSGIVSKTVKLIVCVGVLIKYTVRFVTSYMCFSRVKDGGVKYFENRGV